MEEDDKNRGMLLEVYKLHADLAEQAAASREGLNKLYTGMVSSIVVASVLLRRLGADIDAMWVLPALGVVVSLCWTMSLHSMTGRLVAKHRVLAELESKLPFAFLTRESAEFDKGGFVRRKWTSVLMPVTFLLICIGWLVALVVEPAVEAIAG